MGKKQGVAAFTGAYTNAGFQLAQGRLGEVWNIMSLVFAFIGGAFICGVLNPKAKPWTLGPPYAYGPGFLIGSVFLFAAGAVAEWYPQSGWYFYLAAAANGLQNGLSSTYSANLLRVCHLTGTSTDIGLILGQLVRGERANLWKLFVLVVLAVAFLLGGSVAYVAMHAFASHALLFSACFFFLIGMGCILFVSVQYSVSILEAASNTACAGAPSNAECAGAP